MCLTSRLPHKNSIFKQALENYRPMNSHSRFKTTSVNTYYTYSSKLSSPLRNFNGHALISPKSHSSYRLTSLIRWKFPRLIKTSYCSHLFRLTLSCLVRVKSICFPMSQRQLSALTYQDNYRLSKPLSSFSLLRNQSKQSALL